MTLVETARPTRARRYFPWPILAGIVFALAVLALAPLLGVRVGGATIDPTGAIAWPIYFIGAFLCGWLMWLLLMPNWSRVSPWAGAAAGVLATVLAYPVVLVLAEIAGHVWAPALTPPGSLDRVVWITGIAVMTTGFPATISMAVLGFFGAWAVSALGPHGPVNLLELGSESRFWRRIRWLAAGLALVLALFLAGAFIYLTLKPVPVEGLSTRPSPTVPATTYEEAMAAAAAVHAEEETLGLHERCYSQVQGHGRKTPLAVVFFHGLTSCPAQGEELAADIFALGYNVYLPRAFGHGEADPNSLSLSELTAEDLVDMVNSSVDLAGGLGEQVIVVGLSMGGTNTVWAAQNRADVTQAIPVSPFLGPYIIPPWATHAAINLVLDLPNLVFWINPLAPRTAPETDYVFAKPSTHTLAEIMRLGYSVTEDARTIPPAAEEISVLINEADVAVSNQLTRNLVDLWRAHGQDVVVRALEFSNHLPHDLINPDEIFGDTDMVYSLLAGLVTGEAEGALEEDAAATSAEDSTN
jgi:pimeloyl-ACP methyl ester carboxylesterase